MTLTNLIRCKKVQVKAVILIKSMLVITGIVTDVLTFAVSE